MAWARMMSSQGLVKTVDITYIANGVTNKQSVAIGDNILALSFSVPAKSGYTFYGWATSNGSGVRIEAGSADSKASIDRTVYGIYLPTTVSFGYTGGVQTFAAKKGVNYLLTVYGAQGGNASDNVNKDYQVWGGAGGKAAGYFKPTSDMTLYICCGGAGVSAKKKEVCAGGYNGGGYGTGVTWASNMHNAGGGGATHIAKANGILANVASGNVLIVAGGGGGATCAANLQYKYNGGAGGSGASGAYGRGTNGTEGAGGGAGWKGGGSGFYSGGGGGSNYIGGVASGGSAAGQRSGNGAATITIASV